MLSIVKYSGDVKRWWRCDWRPWLLCSIKTDILLSLRPRMRHHSLQSMWWTLITKSSLLVVPSKRPTMQRSGFCSIHPYTRSGLSEAEFVWKTVDLAMSFLSFSFPAIFHITRPTEHHARSVCVWLGKPHRMDWRFLGNPVGIGNCSYRNLVLGYLALAVRSRK